MKNCWTVCFGRGAGGFFSSVSPFLRGGGVGQFSRKIAEGGFLPCVSTDQKSSSSVGSRSNSWTPSTHAKTSRPQKIGRKITQDEKRYENSGKKRWQKARRCAKMREKCAKVHQKMFFSSKFARRFSRIFDGPNFGARGKSVLYYIFGASGSFQRGRFPNNAGKCRSLPFYSTDLSSKKRPIIAASCSLAKTVPNLTANVSPFLSGKVSPPQRLERPVGCATPLRSLERVVKKRKKTISP